MASTWSSNVTGTMVPSRVTQHFEHKEMLSGMLSKHCGHVHT